MLGAECGNNDFRICGKDIEIQLNKYLMFIGNAFITCHSDRKDRYINISTVVDNMISCDDTGVSPVPNLVPTLHLMFGQRQYHHLSHYPIELMMKLSCSLGSSRLASLLYLDMWMVYTLVNTLGDQCQYSTEGRVSQP